MKKDLLLLLIIFFTLSSAVVGFTAESGLSLEEVPEKKVWGENYRSYVWLRNTVKEIEDRRSKVQIREKQLSLSRSIFKNKGKKELPIIAERARELEADKKAIVIIVLQYNNEMENFYKKVVDYTKKVELLDHKLPIRFSLSDFTEEF